MRPYTVDKAHHVTRVTKKLVTPAQPLFFFGFLLVETEITWSSSSIALNCRMHSSCFTKTVLSHTSNVQQWFIIHIDHVLAKHLSVSYRPVVFDLATYELDILLRRCHITPRSFDEDSIAIIPKHLATQWKML